MKTLKIITLLLVTLLICTNNTFALSPGMQRAMDISKKVEAKKKIYDNIVEQYSIKINQITALYITKNKEEILIEKYNDILDKISDIRVSIKNSTSIYKGILVLTLNQLEDVTGGQIVVLEDSFNEEEEEVVFLSVEEEGKIIEESIE
jgi:hypothetical protein